MRFGLPIGFVLLASVLAACTAQDWSEWKAHSTHFASGDHMTFSLKNMGSTPRVSSADSRLASSQSWWGRPVVVREDQIFQN
jgi:hypothetical protein